MRAKNQGENPPKRSLNTFQNPQRTLSIEDESSISPELCDSIESPSPTSLLYDSIFNNQTDVRRLIIFLLSTNFKNEFFNIQREVIDEKCKRLCISRDISNLEIIRPRDLPQATGLSRTTCWRLSRDPTSGFPPKIRLSAGAIGYSKRAIEEWLQTREE